MSIFSEKVECPFKVGFPVLKRWGRGHCLRWNHAHSREICRLFKPSNTTATWINVRNWFSGAAMLHGSSVSSSYRPNNPEHKNVEKLFNGVIFVMCFSNTCLTFIMCLKTISEITSHRLFQSYFCISICVW